MLRISLLTVLIIILRNNRSIPENVPLNRDLFGTHNFPFQVIFSLNGSPLRPYSQIFKRVRQGFFAAASFMTYQQCEFNFGQKPFKYPPRDYEFSSFNAAGSLTPEQRLVLPRPKRHESRKLTISNDSCALCCDEKANIQLEPCHHQGLCRKCADLLEICPMCRRPIQARIPLKVGLISPVKPIV